MPLDGKRTVREIIALVEAEYGDDASNLTADVTAMLADLRGHDVLSFR